MYNSIDGMWRAFERRYISPHAGQDYHAHMRTAFYAGAGGVLMLLHKLDEARVSSEAGSAILRGLQSELHDFPPPQV